jgi:hypothetical protein
VQGLSDEHGVARLRYSSTVIALGKGSVLLKPLAHTPAAALHSLHRCKSRTRGAVQARTARESTFQLPNRTTVAL